MPRVQYRDKMEMFSNLRKEQGLGSIVSYCVSPVPCTGPSPVPMQYE